MFRCIYKKPQTTKSLAFVIIPLDGLNIVTEVFHASKEMIIPLPSYQEKNGTHSNKAKA
ncbi:hypothetical protein GCM10008931_15970 [Oceanobacillus oncorhynchi subsp. oncorhynchi]|uniref:hypothetical protein n=1 Tax=Oceanobacillus oncorhynchi TaxID=545501 RepID=UPI0031DEC735